MTRPLSPEGEPLSTGSTTDAIRGWRQYVDPHLPGLRGTALLAVSCNLVLELSRLFGVEGYPWRFKTPAFLLVFLLGSLVVWLAGEGALALRRSARLAPR